MHTHFCDKSITLPIWTDYILDPSMSICTIIDGKQYAVTITSITCRHLANVELMGENDPYVKISYDQFVAKTEYQDGAGKEAEWEKLNFMFAVSDKSVTTELLLIEVLDYNAYRKHVSIGQAAVNLSAFSNHVGLITSVADHLDEEVEIVVDLHNDKKIKSGEVTLFMRVEAAMSVFISSVEVNDLKNVEFMGK